MCAASRTTIMKPMPVLVVWAIRAACQGHWQGGAGLLDFVSERLPDTLVRDRMREITGQPDSQLSTIAERFGCSGYVVESVPLARFAAERVDMSDFAAMIGQVVRCGGDTDTNAAIAGQVAGTLVGEPGISPDLIQRLPQRERVLAAARDLLPS
jgi:ADP-ribosyl-[dinitrogen reductase] hydrolase